MFLQEQEFNKILSQLSSDIFLIVCCLYILFFITFAACPDIACPAINPIHGSRPGFTSQGTALSFRIGPRIHKRQ